MRITDAGDAKNGAYIAARPEVAPHEKHSSAVAHRAYYFVAVGGDGSAVLLTNEREN